MLKDYLASDMRVFFNDGEFADMHNIDGHDVDVIIDNDRLIYRSKKEYDGISVGEVLFYVKIGDLPKPPKEGMPIIFDNRQMYIFSLRKDGGMYEIVLSQNIGG